MIGTGAWPQRVHECAQSLPVTPAHGEVVDKQVR